MKRSRLTPLVLIILCLVLCPGIARTMSLTQEPDDFLDSDYSGIEPAIPPSAAVVSSTISNAILVGHLVLDYTDPTTALLTNELLKALDRDDPPNLHASIRNVDVDGYGSLANWTALSVGIEQLNDVASLHWKNNDPIPENIITALASHPACRLHYEMPFSNWDPYDETVDPIQPVGSEPHRNIRQQTRRLIVNSANLYALTAHIEYGGRPDPESLKLIHDVLVSCPNIRELDLAVSHSGCVVADDQPYAFDFSKSSEPFAPLEVLRLNNYRLDNPYDEQSRWSLYYPDQEELRWPWYHLPKFIWQPIWDFMGPPAGNVLKRPSATEPNPCPWKGRCEHKFNATTNLDGWLERMDFTNLHTLDLSTISSTSLLKFQTARVLTNLSHLHIHSAGGCAADVLPGFISSLEKPLSTLCIGNVNFDDFQSFLNSMTSTTNNSLTTLSISEDEELRQHYCHSDDSRNKDALVCRAFGRGAWYDPHLYLTPSDLLALSKSNPRIQTLHIDMDRNNSFINSTLDALGSFTNLETLTLQFESPTFQHTRQGIREPGPHGYDALYDPLLNRSSVLDMFRRVRAAQADNLNKSNTAAELLDEYEVVGDMPATKPKLREMYVIDGRWSSRYSSGGMVGPEQNVIGRFHCSVRGGDHDSEEGEEHEVCTGGITFPSHTFAGYELRDAYGLPLTLDEDGLWDPGLELPLLTRRRLVYSVQKQVDWIDILIELKMEKKGYTRDGYVVALEEVRAILRQELEEERARLDEERAKIASRWREEGKGDYEKAVMKVRKKARAGFVSSETGRWAEREAEKMEDEAEDRLGLGDELPHPLKEEVSQEVVLEREEDLELQRLQAEMRL